MNRRTFIATAGLAVPALAAESGMPKVEDVNFRALISQGDLRYDKPVARSEEGMPIGNGRMGSLVWTAPDRLRFQINRNDVYANNSYTNSFYERNNDYCGGCGFVDIVFDSGSAAPFPDSGFTQHLSIYDGALQMEGKGVTARIAAWPAADVMAVEIESSRPASAILRMLRFDTKYFGGQLETFAREHAAAVETRNHMAISRMEIRGKRTILTQEFREGKYFCKSTLVIAVAGRDGVPGFSNEEEVHLNAAGTARKYTFLIATGASFDEKEDITAAAMGHLDEAEAKGAALFTDVSTWWRNFWSRGYVEMTGGNEAEFVALNYNYFLYLMASTSQEKFPTKFNGMLWNSDGDLRTWGAQHWFANLSCYYEALPATNRWELMDPMFDMYWGMYDASAVAAQQEWGSKGIYIAETSYFDGLEKLPDDIAAEMSQLYLLKKPWDQRSEKFREYAMTKHPHSSRWNWIQASGWKDGRWTITERGSGPFGNVSHILGSNAKIAYLFWRRYEFTLDKEWLRTRAYPMLRGAVEFYRNFPNVEKGADGKYHIHGVNSNESVWGARDTDEDISSMRGVFGAILRASEILNVDGDMRPVWSEFLQNLAPLPDSSNPEALRPENYTGPRVFARALKPAVKGGTGLRPDGNSLPEWFFDLCNVESKDKEILAMANATFDSSFRNGIGPTTQVQVLSKQAIAAASLGRADAVRHLIPNQFRGLGGERPTAYKNGGALSNRMMLREGPQALDAERLGRASEALHMALLQSNPPAPGEDPVLHVFPAWPKEWNGRFRLAARGAFTVSSSCRAGKIEYVLIESQAGSQCTLRNPFEGAAVLYRNGNKAEVLNDRLLRFKTAKNEKITVAAS